METINIKADVTLTKYQQYCISGEYLEIIEHMFNNNITTISDVELLTEYEDDKNTYCFTFVGEEDITQFELDSLPDAETIEDIEECVNHLKDVYHNINKVEYEFHYCELRFDEEAIFEDNFNEDTFESKHDPEISFEGDKNTVTVWLNYSGEVEFEVDIICFEHNANLFHESNLYVKNEEIYISADSDSISGVYFNNKFYFTECSDEPVEIEDEEKIFKFNIVDEKIIEVSNDSDIDVYLDDIDDMQMKVGELYDYDDIDSNKVVYSINLLNYFG